MAQVTGYTVADYLLRHATRERRYARVPASTWDAAFRHLRDPSDAARLANSAESRLLYRYAIPLYRHDAGDGDAAPSGQSAGQARGPGRATGPGRRRPTDRPPGSWPTCWPSGATWTGYGPGQTPATGLRPTGWPTCWPGTATSTGRRNPAPRADAGGPGLRPTGWPTCWPGTATSRGANPAPRADAVRRQGCGRPAGRPAGRARQHRRGLAQILRPGLTPATGLRPTGWPTCWPGTATSTGPANPAPRADAGDRAAADRLADLLAGHGNIDGACNSCAPGRRRDGLRPTGWPTCWPGGATSTRRSWCPCASSGQRGRGS